MSVFTKLSPTETAVPVEDEVCDELELLEDESPLFIPNPFAM